jgi:hypothetical protein
MELKTAVIFRLSIKIRLQKSLLEYSNVWPIVDFKLVLLVVDSDYSIAALQETTKKTLSSIKGTRKNNRFKKHEKTIARTIYSSIELSREKPKAAIDSIFLFFSTSSN